MIARQLVGGFAEPALVLVADDDDRAFLGAALGGREADAGAGGGGDEHRLAGEERVRGRAGWRRLWSRFFRPSTRGSRGMPSARSAMMLRWIWLVPA